MPTMRKGVRLLDASSLAKATKTPQGFLKAPALVTRTGVLTYRLKDGSLLRQLRLPDEVFKPESMQTLAGIPLTDTHPDCVLLDAKTTTKHMRGFTGETVEREDNYLRTTITVTDADLIKQIESKEKV